MNKQVWKDTMDVLIILALSTGFIGLCFFSKKLFMIVCFVMITVCVLGVLYSLVSHFNYQNRKR